MTELGISNSGPLGGANRVVESDETFIGGKAANRKGKIPPKAAVLSLVERDGRVRSFHVPNVTAQTLRPIMTANVDRASYLMTDESPVYWSIGRQFAGHGAVNHSAEEYVRAYFWHTNTRSSSAGSTAAISTSPRLICTVTPPSSISGTTIESLPELMIWNGPIARSSA
jgi:hypothetical protein